MTDDYDNTHDYDAKLYVGDLEIASFEERIPPELLAVFADQMYRARPLAIPADPREWEPEFAEEFAAPGVEIADRLDILSFTAARVRQALDGVFNDARGLSDLVEMYSPDTARPRDYTAGEWITELRASAGRIAAPGYPEPESAVRLMTLIKDADRRVALRAVLLACPDDEVRLDVTHLHAMGALETLDGLCSSGLEAIRAAASADAPLVVLAEGSTDVEFLAAGLRLLYPHLSDLIRFLDFGQRPNGGAGALVNTVKSFAAAGITNRVVALFDNDTAAADALRPWDISGLPANTRVCQYPPLELAADYPTLGAPPAHTQVANADVNGLAGSIELYLGRDVLTDAAGNLRPVHWRTYIRSMRQYQGEIADKGAVQDAYRAKVRLANSDRSRIAQQDWSGVRAILDLVRGAFD